METIQLKIYVQPGAKKSEVSGEHDGLIKIRINCPPVEGKANSALIGFLAKILKIRKSSIKITKGETSRTKHIEITCANSKELAHLDSKIKELC